MFKYIFLVLLIIGLSSKVAAYNKVDLVSVDKDTKLVKVRIKCDDKSSCSDIPSGTKLKLMVMAKLRSVKSWGRLLKNGYLIKHHITGIPDGKIVTFIICNSVDNKIIDKNYGIEILYVSRVGGK